MSFENKGSIPTSVLVTVEPDRSGNIVADGTADNVEIQEAFDRLSGTAWEKVIVKGDMDIAAKLNIPDYCWLQIIGDWTLANSVDDYMIENTSFDMIRIDGAGLLDGNGGNQAAGGILNFTGSGGAYDRGWIDGSLSFEDGYDSNIRLTGVGRWYIGPITSSGRLGATYNLVMSCYDSQVYGSIFTGSADENVSLFGSAGNHFAGVYFGGAAHYNVQINATCYSNDFAGCGYYDSVRHGIVVSGDRNTFCGGRILPDATTTDNTYSAIYVDDGEDNIFTGMIAEGRASHRWKYGFEEVSTGDYNLVNGLNTRTQIGTAATLVVGANSSAVNIIG